MIRFRQRNLLWLSILGGMTTIALIAGGSPLAALLLLGLFGAAVAGSFINLNTARPLVGALQQRAPVVGGSRVSAQAREAVSRASSRGGYANPALTLLDVGLIGMYSGGDGMVMRRARTVSKEDDSVRPFVTLNVAPAEADRTALLRFEIIDHNGREQYIHEMRVYLRDGEVNILADHHLPLFGNPQIEGFGGWDLRVLLDGNLLGLHAFTLSPSDEERRTRLAGSAPRRHFVQGDDDEDEDDSDIPMTLEQLLRNQGQNRDKR